MPMHPVVKKMSSCLSILSITILLVLCSSSRISAEEKPPVRIGITAEFGLPNSFSAQAVEMGIRVALQEINDAGGVLDGRPLLLEVRDDRSVPARAMENIKELAAMPDMVAVFGARFSPVLIELIPLVHEIGMILLDPWGSADGIVQHGYTPSYTFRLSLYDSLAMPKMLSHAQQRGLTKIGLLLPNTAWGRSNLKAAEDFSASNPSVKLIRIRWYNWGDTSLLNLYQDLFGAGADVLVLVANDREGSILVNEIVTLPETQWLPILSHWGITGGDFFQKTESALQQLDFSVIQTFSFFKVAPAMREHFMAQAARLYPIESFEEIEAPVGVGHAYDLTHLLAGAIDQAGNTAPSAVRAALEQLGPYQGLVKNFERPFTPENHEALSMDSVFMAIYRDDGALIPIAISSDSPQE